MSVSTDVVNWDRLRQELAAARSIEDLKNGKDKAELLVQCGKKFGWHLEDRNNAAEAFIRFARRMGELLREMPKNEGNNFARPSHDGRAVLPKLVDLGITYNESSRCQATAVLPEEMLEQHIAEVKDKRKELTHAGVLQLVKQYIRGEEQRQQAEQANEVVLPASIQLFHGDFYAEVQKLAFGCVDLILTDPPYNIARENEFELEGRSNISQNFGEWDKHKHQDFIDLFALWASEWARILRIQGSGYVFTSDSYISYLRSALEWAGLNVKATIIWHKVNPGTQVVKTNFRSSVEYILFFTKGEGGHTFNWQGENEMHNFIEAPICAGNERLKDDNGKTLHPTQKPEQILAHLAKISSNRGDTIFDGFMGVGSTGQVAKDLDRKFIGIEQDKTFFEAAQRRLAE